MFYLPSNYVKKIKMTCIVGRREYVKALKGFDLERGQFGSGMYYLP